MTAPDVKDRERARGWWVRTLGFLSAVDDGKVDSLAREFAAVRNEERVTVAREALEYAERFDPKISK